MSLDDFEFRYRQSVNCWVVGVWWVEVVAVVAVMRMVMAVVRWWWCRAHSHLIFQRLLPFVFETLSSRPIHHRHVVAAVPQKDVAVEQQLPPPVAAVVVVAAPSFFLPPDSPSPWPYRPFL